MYRLSLDDSRLFLPAPVYRLKNDRYLMRDGVDAAHAWDQVAGIPFFALPPDRKRAGTIEIGGLFYALPVAAAKTTPGVLGAWTCDEDLEVDFRAEGERIAVEAGGMTGTGTLRGGAEGGSTVEFAVRQGDAVVRGTAFAQAGKLAITWKDAQNAGGQLTCGRAVLEEQWLNSQALVPLYSSGGVYSTQSSRGARPIARVWRNPAGKLLLDRGASPADQ
jgi:hypothetical protein